MIIECGPTYDRRLLKIVLPIEPQRIGILVSGGIDSALLYYLLMRENDDIGQLHDIIPYTIMRKDGSKVYSAPVINYISKLFGKKTEAIIVGDNRLPEHNQVLSGLLDIWSNHDTDTVYVGVIETLSIHMFGLTRNTVRETARYKIPMQHLNKSHIIDLINQFGQTILFELTHGCLVEIGRCGTCSGCKERSWGFEQMGIIDTGTI